MYIKGEIYIQISVVYYTPYPLRDFCVGDSCFSVLFFSAMSIPMLVFFTFINSFVDSLLMKNIGRESV